jgi:hypothetical protein
MARIASEPSECEISNRPPQLQFSSAVAAALIRAGNRVGSVLSQSVRKTMRSLGSTVTMTRALYPPSFKSTRNKPPECSCARCSRMADSHAVRNRDERFLGRGSPQRNYFSILRLKTIIIEASTCWSLRMALCALDSEPLFWLFRCVGDAESGWLPHHVLNL